MKRRQLGVAAGSAVVLSLTGLAGCQSTAPTSQPSGTASGATDIDLLLDRYRQRGGATGALLISGPTDDATPLSIGRDIFSDRPIALASISKIVTAYMCRRAQMEGALNYSDTAGDFLSGSNLITQFPEIGSLTVRQLIQHRSGLAPVSSYNYNSVEGRLRDATSRTVSVNTYANDNYTLLTLIIEAVFGNYDTALQRFVRSEGLSSFRIGRYHGLRGYAGAGELEATPSDMHRLILRAAPLSESGAVDTFGDGWFHERSGLSMVGQHDIQAPGRRLRWQTEAYWSAEDGGVGSFFVMDGLTDARSPVPGISRTLAT